MKLLKKILLGTLGFGSAASMQGCGNIDGSGITW